MNKYRLESTTEAISIVTGQGEQAEVAVTVDLAHVPLGYVPMVSSTLRAVAAIMVPPKQPEQVHGAKGVYAVRYGLPSGGWHVVVWRVCNKGVPTIADVQEYGSMEGVEILCAFYGDIPCYYGGDHVPSAHKEMASEELD